MPVGYHFVAVFITRVKSLCAGFFFVLSLLDWLPGQCVEILSCCLRFGFYPASPESLVHETLFRVSCLWRDLLHILWVGHQQLVNSFCVSQLASDYACRVTLFLLGTPNYIYLSPSHGGQSLIERATIRGAAPTICGEKSGSILLWGVVVCWRP